MNFIALKMLIGDRAKYIGIVIGLTFSSLLMQLKIHLGEFAPAGVLQQPLLLMGAINPLGLRVDVDENDAWRVRAGAADTGYLRGNKDIKKTLKFARFEPYVVPKVSLTGESTERVDTRVLQVIFTFERGPLPIFVGQQTDVFIDAGGITQQETAVDKKERDL